MALFVHHRDRVPAWLEKRLLPKRIVKPFRKKHLTEKQSKHKSRLSVICLPDQSKSYRLPVRDSDRKIVSEVCKRHSLSLETFYGRSRLRNLVDARAEACYLFAVNTDYTVTRIGREIRRDHTSVLYMIKRYCRNNGVPFPRERIADAASRFRKSIRRHSDRPVEEPEIRPEVS